MRKKSKQGSKSKKCLVAKLRLVTKILVSFAAVIRVVTQRFSPTDDPNNGCEGDYENLVAALKILLAKLIEAIQLINK